MRAFGLENPGAKDGELLQYLGTEWGRGKYGEDVWVKILNGKISNEIDYMARSKPGAKELLIVVPDTRFRNELDGVPGAIKVRLECKEEIRKSRCTYWRDNSGHQSEVDLDGSIDQFDLVIDTGYTGAMDAAKKIFDLLMTKSDRNLV